MEEIDDILAKHFSGESNPMEEEKVLRWKQEHPSEYDLLAKSWNETIDFNVRTYDEEAAWNKLESQIQKPATRIFTLSRVYRFAAAATLAILMGVALTWYLAAPEYILVENKGDQAKELLLPDGSIIWISGGSQVEYAADFQTNRSIKLNGTAFFEVEKDAAHPFVIETKTSEVEVLGTGFNVESTAAYTKVSVVHGLVALRNEHAEVKLSAGESASATETELSAIVAVAPNTNSWISGQFVFDGTPLTQVVEQLNGYYQKDIVLSTEKAKTKTLTAKFENQSLDEVIEIIVLTCDLESEVTEHTVVLK